MAGQFGNAIPGGVDNVTAALKRRGLEVPALSQTSGGAPSNVAIPEASNIEGTVGPRAPSAPKLPDGEKEIIVKALANRLKQLGVAETQGVQPLI